ncbi:MAG: hypothetical protein ACYC2T_14275 [Bacillota bacterium]
MKGIPNWVLSIIAAVTGAFLLVSVLGKMTFHIEAFEITVGIQNLNEVF